MNRGVGKKDSMAVRKGAGNQMKARKRNHGVAEAPDPVNKNGIPTGQDNYLCLSLGFKSDDKF